MNERTNDERTDCRHRSSSVLRHSSFAVRRSSLVARRHWQDRCRSVNALRQTACCPGRGAVVAVPSYLLFVVDFADVQPHSRQSLSTCQQSVNSININSKAASTIDREVQILHQPTIVNQPTEPQLVACHWQLLLTLPLSTTRFLHQLKRELLTSSGWSRRKTMPTAAQVRTKLNKKLLGI